MILIVQGNKGGPMEVVGGFVSNWLSSQSTKIEVQENNGSVSATISSFGQIKSQRLKNEAGEQMKMQNVGFAMVFQFNNQRADLAPS